MLVDLDCVVATQVFRNTVKMYFYNIYCIDTFDSN